MSTCVFIQIRCKPGTTYKVAEDIALLEIHSELYSTSGDALAADCFAIACRAAGDQRSDLSLSTLRSSVGGRSFLG